MKNLISNQLKTILLSITISIGANQLFAQDNTTVYPSGTTSAPGAATIPAPVSGSPNKGNTLFDNGAPQWQASTFLRLAPQDPFTASGTTPTSPDFDLFRVGEGYDPQPVRMQLFGGNFVQTPDKLPFSTFTPTTGIRYNAIGDRVPFGGTNAPGIRTTGLRSQWDKYAANFGLTDAATTGGARNALISWQDATANNLDDVATRLVFGKRDQTTTNFGELATILGNGNMGIGIATPIIKLQVQDGNIGQTSDGHFGAIGSGNRWTAIGGRVPFGGINPLIRQEGIRTQWDRYGVGLGLSDGVINSAVVKDAILSFQDANADFPNGTFSQNRFILGARDSVGPGSDSNNFRAYIVVRGDNGNTGIGLNSFNPSAKLEIIGNGGSPSTRALSVQNSSNDPLLTTRDDGFTGVIVTSPITPFGNFSLAGNPPMMPSPGSIFFSVEENMSASGSLFVGNDVYATSDARVKKDFKELSEDADWKRVLNIPAYSYKFDQEKVDNIKFDPRTRYGFKAQDVEKNIPELTIGWGDALVVNYQGFVPFLTAGLQEHEQEIDEVVEENKKIKEVNETIVKENETLKTQVKSLEDKLNDLYNLPAIQNALKESKQSGTLDAKAQLFQNEPNPFGAKTIIRYSVPTTAKVAVIKVVNNSGAEMGEYKLKTGNGELEITAGSIPAGNYNYSLYVDNNLVDTKKMVIINY